MGFGENIRVLRASYDLTQEQLATIAGVTDKAVSAWESGLRQPRPKVAQRLAKHFGVSYGSLLDDHFSRADPTSLSEAERDLLGLFRILSESDKDLMVKLIKRLG